MAQQSTRRRKRISRPTLLLEARADGTVCGVDEVGVAPLAGPVLAAAVILPQGSRRPRSLGGLTDSKQLPASERERLATAILRVAKVGIGAASVAEIDRLNIYHATMLAMRRALDRLPDRPAVALVDGNRAPDLPCSVQTIVKGDTKSLSIAAASVVAKVTRDRLMRYLDVRYPGYGWSTNVGYGTDEHYLGLLHRGPTAHHRRSFAPVTMNFPGGGDPSEHPAGEPDLIQRATGIMLFKLREDLHAVFDGERQNIGVLKATRGHWRLRAIAFDDFGQPVIGAGPLSDWHGHSIPGPDEGALARLVSTRPVHT